MSATEMFDEILADTESAKKKFARRIARGEATKEEIVSSPFSVAELWPLVEDEQLAMQFAEAETAMKRCETEYEQADAAWKQAKAAVSAANQEYDRLSRTAKRRMEELRGLGFISSDEMIELRAELNNAHAEAGCGAAYEKLLATDRARERKYRELISAKCEYGTINSTIESRWLKKSGIRNLR
jgi:hypothetical protein